MNKRNTVLHVLVVLLFTVGLTFGQDASSSQNNSGLSGLVEANSAASASLADQSNSASTANATSVNPLATLDLKYIWSVNGIEEDQIIIALDQEEGDLFGQAKYEPENGEPWNGEVAGSVSGNQVRLVLTALKGKKQVSTVLDGIFADEAISGNFFQTSAGEILNRGEFNAMWINPDLSSYTPAEIKESKSEMQTTAANLAAPADTPSQQKSRFYDVRQDADRILTGVGDISQIPIGMGGSGLGGGSGLA